MKRKVLIIGFDAADYNLIKEFIHKGLLNFNKFTLFSKLISTIPPHSAPSWTSMITGVNPGKHGLFDFYDPISHKVNFLPKSIPTIFELLSSMGLKVVAINIPTLYPVRSIRNGVLISGLLAPSLNEKAVYPPSLLNVLRKNEYEIDIKNFVYLYKKDLDFLINTIFDIEKRRFEVAKYLLTNLNWDVAFIVHVHLDRIQHFFWHFYDRSHPLYSEGHKEYRDLIPKAYKFSEDIIRKYMEFLDDDDIILIVSDHGMRPLHTHVFINTWLYRKGFIRINKLHLLLYRERPYELIAKIIKNKLAPFIYQGYSLDGFKIIDKNHEQLLKEILEKQLIDIVTGKRIVKKILKRDEVCKGPYANRAPDFFVLYEEGYQFHHAFSDKTMDIAKHNGIIKSGIHSLNGVFFSNKYLKQIISVKNNELRPWNIAAIIFKALGKPVPAHFDA